MSNKKAGENNFSHRLFNIKFIKSFMNVMSVLLLFVNHD